MTKFEAFLNLMRQPSTVKGILGLIAVFTARLGLKDFLSPEEYNSVLEGIGALYFGIAIFWQKS